MGWSFAIVLLVYITAVFGDSHGGGGGDDDYMVDWKDQEKHVNRFCRPELHSCFPSQLEWARLDDKLNGTLAWPDVSFDYSGYNYQYNLRTFTFPLVHAVCKTEEDIQNAVKFAKKNKLRVTIKSSGHELWGRSSAHGSFSINLMEMKKIDVNTQPTERSPHGEVTVQTGANFAELYTKVEAADRTVVGGSGGKVSPGGYIAGGGHSPLSPQFGLGVDNVLEIRVVLADGRIATCTENTTVIVKEDGSTENRNGDLFWALRGGGGGTFAIVVHYVLKLHQAPDSFVAALITSAVYNKESDTKIGKAFLDTYFNWTKTASSGWSGYLYLNNIQTAGEVALNSTYNTTYHNTGRIRGFLIKYSPWDGKEKEELQEFYDLKESFKYPMTVSIGLSNHTNLWENYLSLDPMYGSYTREYTLGALITPEKHDGGLRDFFVDELLDGDNGDLHCFLTRLGGKVMEFDEMSSSVNPGFRKARSSVVCSMAATGEGLNEIVEQDRLKQKASDFHNKLHHFAVGDYINEGYAPNPNWKLDFWGPAYVKLLMVKIRYDPDNIFWCYHCVGSDRDDWDFGEYSVSKSPNFAIGFSTLLLVLFTTVLI